MGQAERRAARLAAYDRLRAQRPALFVNPPGAAYEILFDRDAQHRVADAAAAGLRQRGLPDEYGDIGLVYQDPRGFGERGADSASTARRELEEELGVAPAELTYLGKINTDSGATAGADELYLARLAGVPAGRTADGTEEGIDEVRVVSPDELAAMLRAGELTDSFTIAAYALAVAHGLVPPA